MKVRIIAKEGYADRYGNSFGYGIMADFPEAIAVKLLQHRIAEVTADQAPIETAAVAPPQNTAKRTGRAKPRRKS